MSCRCVRGFRACLYSQDFGQAKIQELDPQLRQHRIGGFQISVDDFCAMCLVQPVRDLNAVLQSLVEWERAFLQSLRERLSLDVLHDDEIDTVLLADIVERADVRVIELRDRLGLTLEACLALWALGEVLGRTLMATVRSSRVSVAL